jgi:heat shock protein HslJ
MPGRRTRPQSLPLTSANPPRARTFAHHSIIAAVAILGWAGAATAGEILACPTDQSVPDAVSAKLDSTLLMIVDSKSATAAGLGYAPGAELFVRAPGWTYHRSVGTLDGDLFKTPETLSSMMDGVPTEGGFTQYGIGIGEKVGGFWGHGGQTLGFESDVGLYRDQDISLVVWTNSGRNLAALGATVIFGALGDVDALAEPADAGSSLVGTGWAWVATEGGGATYAVDDPSRYTILFQQAGDVAVRADCNRVLGSYKGDGDALSLTLTASTKVLCPEGSQEDRFVQELSQTATARVEGDRLFLVLTADGKTMEFQRHAD